MSAVFITGAARNTGLAVARRFASAGYDVALSSRDAGDARTAAAALADEYGVKAHGYALDLADVADIERVFRQVAEDFDGIGVFVANAAELGVDLDLLTVTPDDYARVMDVNLRGTYFCCQQAGRIMMDSGVGAIVIIGSVHYKQSIWGRSLYAMSKGALATLTRSAAIELAPYGVRVNYVVAGAIRTDRWDDMTSEQVAARRKNWPLPESTGADIANGVFYLGTDESRTVTGTDLTIDSGVGISLLPYEGGQRR